MLASDNAANVLLSDRKRASKCIFIPSLAFVSQSAIKKLESTPSDDTCQTNLLMKQMLSGPLLLSPQQGPMPHTQFQSTLLSPSMDLASTCDFRRSMSGSIHQHGNVHNMHLHIVRAFDKIVLTNFLYSFKENTVLLSNLSYCTDGTC